MLKGGVEEERRGTQVEALDSLKPKKKLVIFLRPPFFVFSWWTENEQSLIEDFPHKWEFMAGRALSILGKVRGRRYDGHHVNLDLHRRRRRRLGSFMYRRCDDDDHEDDPFAFSHAYIYKRRWEKKEEKKLVKKHNLYICDLPSTHIPTC